MNEEIPSQSQAAPESSLSATEVASPPPAAGGGLPSWLPYLLIAIVPAAIVGILVYVFAGGSSNGGGSDSAAGLLETFLIPEASSNVSVESFKSMLPEEFPVELPLFEDAMPIASFTVASPEGTRIYAFFSTNASASDVFAHYQDALDSDPWQIELGQSGSQITGLRFSRPDNPDVSGFMIANESELDGLTVIEIVYDDIAASLAPGTAPSVPADLGFSQPLPPGFPESVPVYNADSSTVIDAGFQRAPGGQLFILTVLTTDSPDDVIAFYREEFEGMGWNVMDAALEPTSLATGIEFDDGEETLAGQVLADTYVEDSAYTQVDIQVQVSGASGN